MNARIVIGAQSKKKLERNGFKIMKGLRVILNSKGQSTKVFILQNNLFYSSLKYSHRFTHCYKFKER